ncbi:hypothetical protein SDC9_134687 [bioreactor metagenome]|uniref:Uncharacterized protein n=1 Tax=bioreactor metagenome TaxID=1076179 RepID=A0A645DE93_9ZZZZ
MSAAGFQNCGLRGCRIGSHSAKGLIVQHEFQIELAEVGKHVAVNARIAVDHQHVLTVLQVDVALHISTGRDFDTIIRIVACRGCPGSHPTGKNRIIIIGSG